jgi:membrane protein implicated in regulation of membrane protease activity
MTWADFYLVCFIAGFCFSFFSFLAGGMRWHLHLPHMPHGPVGGVGHPPLAHGTPHASGGSAVKGGTAKGARVTVEGGQVSPFNFVTFTAFLAWFGGIGFLLTRFSSMWFVMGLGIALMSGIGGATIIYLFISKILTSQEENMDPADYDMVGVLGKICSSIREGGTGELIYSQAGTRRVCGARAENGAAIPKGSEVVVTRYERGLAYVRLWEEMTEEENASQAADSASQA